MQISEWLSLPPLTGTKPDMAQADRSTAGAPGAATDPARLTRARLEALLPSEGLQVGPPEAEDRLVLSAATQLVLRAGQELSVMERERLSYLRQAYLDGSWQVDASALAVSMVHVMKAESTNMSAESRPELDGGTR